MSRKAMDEKERFLSKIIVQENGCWDWRGCLDKDGYGQFYLKRNGKEMSIRPHRYSWIINNGSLSIGLVVCHSCDNPKCVNPKHLFSGTQKENIRDALIKGRMLGPRGSKQHCSILKEENIPEIRRLSRKGISGNQIAKKFKVQRNVIYDILNKVTWKHIID